jgi:cobalt transporter subunit CbtA
MRRVLLPALLAGIAAGVVVTILQQVFLVPLILHAETLELAETLDLAGSASAVTEGGLRRTAYSLLFNCLGAIGFGLLLTGCYALRGGVTWRRGLLWGLAGFASFSLAPALGLPPELPGTQAADLVARQLWWILTVTTTAAGLACICFSRPLLLRLLGVVLIAIPHVAGAPRAPEALSPVPESMAHAFATNSLAVSAVMWLILGCATAALARVLSLNNS